MENNHKQLLKSTCFINLFSSIVKTYPDNIALESDQITLSYKRLHVAVNNMSQRLLNQLPDKVKEKLPNDYIIAICLPRGHDFIIAMLACVQIGIPYLPIDNDLPAEVIKSRLSDSQSKAIILNKNLNYSLQIPQDCNQISFDTSKTNFSTSPTKLKHKSQLMYVMYTSGSTGKPKGVMVPHKGIINCLAAHNKVIKNGILPSDHIAQYSQVSFDASVIEILMALGTGATLVIIPSEIRMNAKDLTHYFNSKKITIAIFTPDKLTLEDMSQKNFKTLRALFIVGDKFKKELSDSWITNSLQVFNGYGLTETTICTTLAECHKNKPLTIGNPIEGFSIHLRPLSDKELSNPVSNISKVDTSKSIKWLSNEQYGAKSKGELFISGIGLANGYWLNKQMTDERFLTVNTNQLVYRTGDIGYFNKEGYLVITGRLGRQIKIRGQRVELGLIEQRLEAHESIECAHVFTIKDQADEIHLAAYLIPCKKELAPTFNQLKSTSLFKTPPDSRTLLESVFSYCSSHLPLFAIPALRYLSLIKNFPIKEGIGGLKGGSDYKSLESLKFPVQPVEKNIVLNNEIEIKIRKIWAEVLKIKETSIAIEDEFNFLGGNSMLYGKMFKRLNTKFDDKIDSIDFPDFFYKCQTIATTRAYLYNNIINPTTPCIPLKTIITNEKVPPLYFIHSLTGDPKEDYGRLLNKVQVSQPIFGLSARKYLGTYPSLELIALDYVKAILKDLSQKNLTHNTPIILIGWSSGGVIAYEMAQQLKRMGLNAKLLMIDAICPVFFQKLSLSQHSYHLQQLIDRLVPLINTYDIDSDLFNKNSKKIQVNWNLINNHNALINTYFKQLQQSVKDTQGDSNKSEAILNRLLQIQKLYLAEMRYKAISTSLKYHHIMTYDHIKQTNQRLAWPCPPEVTKQYDTNHFAILGLEDTIQYVNNFGQKPIDWRLLAKYEYFVGREKELDFLQREAYKNKRVTHIIQGSRGIGKTKLIATHIASMQQLGAYQLIACFYGENNLVNEFRLFAKGRLKLSIDSGYDEQSLIENVYHSLAERQKCLLVFDSIDNEDTIVNFIKPDRPKNIHILVTSHTNNWKKQLQKTLIKSFSKKESFACLKKILPNISENDAELLASKLSHYPLAISQAAAYIDQFPQKITNYIQLLDEDKAELFSEVLSRDDTYKRTMLSILKVSLNAIKKTDTKNILYIISLLAPVPITIGLLSILSESLIDIPITQTSQNKIFIKAEILLNNALSQLQRALILHKEHDGVTWTIHPLIQELIYTQIESKADLLRKLRPILKFKYPNYSPSIQMQNLRLRRNHPHLLKLLTHLYNDESAPSVAFISLSNTLLSFLQCERSLTLLPISIKKIISHIDNNLLDKFNKEYASLCLTLADVYRTKGQHTESKNYAHNAIKYAPKIKTITMLATFKLAQACMYIKGEQNLAKRCLKYLLEKNPSEQGPYYHELGMLYRNQSNYLEAKKYFEQAIIEKQKQFGSQHKQVAVSLHSYAEVLAILGYLKNADKAIERAINLKRIWHAGNSSSEILSLTLSLNIKRRCGRYYDAQKIMGFLIINGHEKIISKFDSARIFLAMANYVDAKKELLTLIKIDSDNQLISNGTANDYVMALFYGKLLLLTGSYSASENLLQDCSNKLITLYNDKESHNTLMAKIFLSQALMKNKKYNEAKKILHLVCESANSVYENNQSPTFGLAKCYLALAIKHSKGKKNEVKRHLSDAEQVQRKIIDAPCHPDLALTLRIRAQIAINENLLKKAKKLLKETMSIQISAYGTLAHPEAIKTFQVYAILLSRKNKYAKATHIQETAVNLYGKIQKHDTIEKQNAVKRLRFFKKTERDNLKVDDESEVNKKDNDFSL